MFFSKFFKKKYPYAPIAYLGRKTVERSLDANIRKLKKVEKEIEEEELHKHDKVDVDSNINEKKKDEKNKSDKKKDGKNKSEKNRSEKSNTEKDKKNSGKKSKK